MFLNYGKQWLLSVLIWLPSVNMQFPMPFMPPPMPPPMPMMNPMVLPPPPPPMPLPGPNPVAFQLVQIQEPKKSAPNEKVERTYGVAIPISFPAPMQFAVGGSSNGPIMGPIMPEYGLQEPSIDGRRPKSKFTRRKRPMYRRFKRSRMSYFFEDCDYDGSTEEFANPVLSYVSHDGEILLEKRLSHEEAAQLMEDDEAKQNVQILAEEDADKNHMLRIVSSGDSRLFLSRKQDATTRRQVTLKSGPMPHVLGEGKKELVFKAPTDKKISNLSVSFQIT